MILFLLTCFRILPLWVAWTLAVWYFWFPLRFFTLFFCMTGFTTTTANWTFLKDSWSFRNSGIWTSWVTSFLLILMAWTRDSSWWLLAGETLILGLIMLCQRITIYKLINLWHQILPILIIQILACNSKPLQLLSRFTFGIDLFWDGMLFFAIRLCCRFNLRLHLQWLITTLLFPS